MDKYDELTADLSSENRTLLTVALPILCGADSDAVEEYIVNHCGKPVTAENFLQVGEFFRLWFAENYPDEYAGSPMALGVPPPRPKRGQKYDRTAWPSERKDKFEGGYAERDRKKKSRFLAATGYATAAQLRKAIESGKARVVKVE